MSRDGDGRAYLDGTSDVSSRGNGNAIQDSKEDMIHKSLPVYHNDLPRRIDLLNVH